MKEEIVGFRKLSLTFLVLFFGLTYVSAQIQAGKVVYERRTNLEKRYKGIDIKRWAGNADLKTPKIDMFELIFNDSTAVFRAIESDIPDERSWFTMRNLTYQNLASNQRKQEFSFFGTSVLLEDSLRKRVWKMTESKRVIAGYNCRQAIWEANDTTRIYAWYAEELLTPVGPETFNGLPGVILGLAIEDGGVVYFAKEVKTYQTNIEQLAPQGKRKDWYTEESLRQLIAERFASFSSAMAPLMRDVFMW